MTNISLTLDAFPQVRGFVRAHWAPIFLTPMAGSSERLVIGVAAANETGFAIAQANALERLRCLYGENAEAAIFASVVALEQLSNEFAAKGTESFTKANPRVTGVHLGEKRDAEGQSLSAIATSWMAAMSSLYRPDEIDAGDEISNDPASGSGDGVDKLPRLVMDYVIQREPNASRFFRQDLIGAQRRKKSHEVSIDFDGSKFVANFGTLQPGKIANSVDHIKRRLWDLKVKRDSESETFLKCQHEMIVFMPDHNDPMFTARQHASLRDAHIALEEQADQEELRLRPLPSIEAIGQRVISGEAGAAS